MNVFRHVEIVVVVVAVVGPHKPALGRWPSLTVIGLLVDVGPRWYVLAWVVVAVVVVVCRCGGQCGGQCGGGGGAIQRVFQPCMWAVINPK